MLNEPAGRSPPGGLMSKFRPNFDMFAGYVDGVDMSTLSMFEIANPLMASR